MKRGQGRRPTATGPALPRVVDSDKQPLRVYFGTAPLETVPHVCAERLKTRQDRADVAAQAQGDLV
ncbi:hypothetical protein ABZT02_34010 [Streptomyces sp. NPDC005402]|uniref:hypothetical protein n=1 Tax=Streptomyces sp. NPDC005402 TaxID=3155338 RepID=UPI0033B05629